MEFFPDSWRAANEHVARKAEDQPTEVSAEAEATALQCQQYLAHPSGENITPHEILVSRITRQRDAFSPLDSANIQVSVGRALRGRLPPGRNTEVMDQASLETRATTFAQVAFNAGMVAVRGMGNRMGFGIFSWRIK
jgi:hypothetical protein